MQTNSVVQHAQSAYLSQLRNAAYNNGDNKKKTSGKMPNVSATKIQPLAIMESWVKKDSMLF